MFKTIKISYFLNVRDSPGVFFTGIFFESLTETPERSEGVSDHEMVRDSIIDPPKFVWFQRDLATETFLKAEIWHRQSLSKIKNRFFLKLKFFNFFDTSSGEQSWFFRKNPNFLRFCPKNPTFFQKQKNRRTRTPTYDTSNYDLSTVWPIR